MYESRATFFVRQIGEFPTKKLDLTAVSRQVLFHALAWEASVRILRAGWGKLVPSPAIGGTE